ncbi:hypothetical protein C2G38_2145910 [Gigaspora rosea]|uniref:BTB/POZ domain-containing protein n=1 Tax=Gigaspora rosea TaxID=44941 RepID=A0A397UNM6_9GLOM|nr:hypothetical protein C2G38_2145910 [Gigaspora rosea]
MVDVKFLESFSNHFAQLLESEYGCDVIIEVGIHQNKQSFRSHKLILYQRSSFFREKLTNNNSIKKIVLPHISVDTFKIIIRYIYTGIISFEEFEISTIFDLLVSSNELGFDELVEYLQKYLIDKNSSWLRLNFTRIHNISFKFDNFKHLQNFYTDILAKHPNLIFDSNVFDSFQENALVTLLKRDDLQAEESIIWDKVIQWGKAQIPDLPSDIKLWSYENFLALKSTLHNCLPLIRYFQIPGKDILEKVKPYRRILEPDLWENITERFIFPDVPVNSIILPARKKIPDSLPSRLVPTIVVTKTVRKKIPDSLPSPTIVATKAVPSAILPVREKIPDSLPSPTIVATKALPSAWRSSIIGTTEILFKRHLLEISSWIDRQPDPYTFENIPYNFKLLLRGSDNGFSSKHFHTLCDNIPNTVIVMKIDGTGEIIGGYNPLIWPSDSSFKWLNTEDSFIFTLRNQNLSTSIISRVDNCNMAIGSSSSHGPYFGNNFYKITAPKSKKWFYRYDHESYSFPIRKNHESFTIVDYEVFQVLKKHSDETEIETDINSNVLRFLEINQMGYVEEFF